MIRRIRRYAAFLMMLMFGLVVVPASAQDAGVCAPGGEIVFMSLRNGGHYDLFMMDADGANVRSLVTQALNDLNPRWSPDGAQVAFHNNVAGSSDIYLINADGSGLRNLTALPGEETFPVWSHDGSEVLYVHDGDLWVIGIATGERRQLTHSPSNKQGIDWSPDGSLMAYTDNPDGNFEIYVMNADGSGVRNLTNTPERPEALPVWSPDGTGLLYMAAGDLHVIDMATGESRNVTNNDAIEVTHGWSADGTQIVFASHQTGNQEIYAINADGTDMRQLTHDPAADVSPVWRPCVAYD